MIDVAIVGVGETVPLRADPRPLSEMVAKAVRQLCHVRGAGQVPDARVCVVTTLGLPHHSTLILERM